jgi:O-antigen/teichoic acid export membrane protein
MIDFSCISGIMGLGFKFFIIQIAALIIYQINNIIIAQITGPNDVTIYNIVYKYFSLSMMLFLIIVTPFWSAFTDAFYKEDFAWMHNSLKKLRKIFFLFIILLLVIFSASNIFYKIWIGAEIKIDFYVSCYMSILFMLIIWNTLHSYILNGIGKITLQLYLSIFGAVAYIPLAIILGKKYGITGVIIASIILNAISALYSPLHVNRLVNKTAKGIWNK